MESPIISVVMPAYNCSKTIAQAVDSVRGQHVDWELLIVEDKSKDSTLEVLEAYKEDKRIRILQNPRNMGAAKSRNRGVQEARGKYIAFLDADDWWTEDKLEKQLKIMEKTGCVLCSTARELVNRNGESAGKIIGVDRRITYHKLLYGNQINCSSVLVRRDIMLRYPMTHEDSHEDYIAWLSILKEHGDAVGINEPMLKYRMDFSSKSGNKGKSAMMHYKALRYAGVGRCRAWIYFCSYAVKGVLKYMGIQMKQHGG